MSVVTYNIQKLNKYLTEEGEGGEGEGEGEGEGAGEGENEPHILIQLRF